MRSLITYLLSATQHKKRVQFFPMLKIEFTISFVDPSRSSYESDEHALEVYKNTVKEISNWIDNLNL